MTNFSFSLSFLFCIRPVNLLFGALEVRFCWFMILDDSNDGTSISRVVALSCEGSALEIELLRVESRMLYFFMSFSRGMESLQGSYGFPVSFCVNSSPRRLPFS